jgi:hypothetical protein
VQLGADYAFERGSGTRFTMTFPFEAPVPGSIAAT